MYEHVMVPLDGSELAECVLPHAEAIATGCRVAKVTLVRVVPPLKLYGGTESRISPEDKHRLEADSVEVAGGYMEEKARELREKGITAATEILFGNVLDQLLAYIGKTGADLVVIATHGRSGMSRLFLGSVADRLVHHSPVPVLVVRAPEAGRRD